MKSRQKTGRFGSFGGRYVSEVLWTPLQELADAFDEAITDEEFIQTNDDYLDHRVGRPTSLSRLTRLTEQYGGGELVLKREDLCHGGSYCATAAAGQALLARRCGRTELIGETATGDFGVALGEIGAALGLKTRVFIGREDHESEHLNVRKMRELGVEIEIVDTSSRGRKAACAEAFRYWTAHIESAMYCASSLAMPDPYPRMLAYFLSVIGAEAEVQLRRLGQGVDYVVAPIGSGAFAAGLFSAFVQSPEIQIVGIQAGGQGQSDKSSASLIDGRPGIFQGTHTYLLQDRAGLISSPHSVAGGLCSALVGPQHARWAEEGRAMYVSVHDEEAFEALEDLMTNEGILVSLETAHAVAYALKLLPTLRSDQVVLVGVTGDGTRDLERLAEHRGEGGSS